MSQMPPEFLASAQEAAKRRTGDPLQNWRIGELAAEALANNYVSDDAEFAAAIGCSYHTVWNCRATWLRFRDVYADPRYAGIPWRRFRAMRTTENAEAAILEPDSPSELSLAVALDRLQRLVDAVPAAFYDRFADELAACELAVRRQREYV